VNSIRSGEPRLPTMAEPGVDADADGNGRLTALGEFEIEPLESALQRTPRGQRFIGVIVTLTADPKKGS